MKKPMNSSPIILKDKLTQETPTPRRYFGGASKPKGKKTPAKKEPSKKKPAPAVDPANDVPKIPEHREDIQAPYKFTDEEIGAMNHGLRNALDDIDTLQSQSKAAAQDFKLRITNRQNDAKQFRNKLTAGEETRPIKAAVEFDAKHGTKKFLHPETGEFIREEQMQPADWQLPMFKPEEVASQKPPTQEPTPAAKGKKDAKPPKSSPVGETSLGDAIDKAAAGTKAPQFWLDLDTEDWTAEGLTKAYKTAAKKAGWSAAQISALGDRLKEAPAISSMIDTLRPFVISAEDRYIYLQTGEEESARVQRVDADLPDGFPLEKITGTFRKAAKKAEWPDTAIEVAVNEAERQARVIGDEPEATEAATRYLRGMCVANTIDT